MSIHLKELRYGDLGEMTIVVGDPGRVSFPAEAFDKHNIIVSDREFFLMNGYYKNQKVSVCSIGIGAGSTEVCVSRLLENGAKQIVCCGGCSTWCDDAKPGDIILNTGTARTTGLMTTYVPDTYPAVADSLSVSWIAKRLSDSKKIRIGLELTVKAYYVGQGRGITIKEKALSVSNMIEEWSNLGIMNCEMEAAVLYILISLYRIPAANYLTIHASRKNEKWGCEEDYRKPHPEMAQLMLDAMLELSSQHESR